jgi:type 1 glutamine amidotransferase
LISVRRRPLKRDQMMAIRQFVSSGKALVGIRTASHAFHLQNGSVVPEAEQWPDFDAVAWGGNYTGHYGNQELPRVTTAAQAVDHPILAGESVDWVSSGSLYRTLPLDPRTTLLWQGSIAGHPIQPVAWTFARADGGRSFYTSLGHRGDFQNPSFQRLLLRAIYWAAERPVP